MSDGRRPQLAYSELQPATHDRAKRQKKAAKICEVLLDFFGRRDLDGLVALDVGSSTGFTLQELRRRGAHAIGADIDAPGLGFARAQADPEVGLLCADGAALPLRDRSVDIVVFNHIYEHLVDPEAVVSEIRRVLKPDGAVYLGLGNRWALVEPHHRLPLLSWLPPAAADRYLRATGQGSEYYERLRSRRQLARLFGDLHLWEYTYTVLSDRERYEAHDLVPRWLAGAPARLWRLGAPIVPTYIWVGTPGRRTPHPARRRAAPSPVERRGGSHPPARRAPREAAGPPAVDLGPGARTVGSGGGSPGLAPAPPPGPVVFVTRKFPPSVGGMETLALGVWRSVAASEPSSVLVANGGSNARLVWWLPAAALRVAWSVRARRVGLVLTGDALTYAALRPVLSALRVRNATMVMGLDVTYDRRLYQAVVGRALRQAPLVIAISTATAARARELGVDRPSVLPLGVPVPDVTAGDRVAAGAALRQRVGLDDGAVLLATLGRLVERKGVRWFASHVLPALPRHVHYLVAGDGPDAGQIRSAVQAAGVAGRVHLLGAVDPEAREVILRGADLFIQANIPVAGDMEGFGLVTVEAAVRGTPVAASGIEGLSDAVEDGVSGFVLPAGDVRSWTAQLGDLVADLEALRAAGARFARNAAAAHGEGAMTAALLELLSGAG